MLKINTAFVKEPAAFYVYSYPDGQIWVQAYTKENDFFKSSNSLGLWRPVKSITPDEIQHEREELYKKYGDTKNPYILNKHIQLRKRQERAVAKLPAVSPELEQRAIMAFNSDSNYKITE